MSNFVETLNCFAFGDAFVIARLKFGTVLRSLDEVAKILGFPGQMDEGAFVVRFGRSDIKVSIDGEPMPTALGFGVLDRVEGHGQGTMVMGDLVLLEKEVNPVISALAGGKHPGDRFAQPFLL